VTGLFLSHRAYHVCLHFSPFVLATSVTLPSLTGPAQSLRAVISVLVRIAHDLYCFCLFQKQSTHFSHLPSMVI
jgi:hypothetical protein